MNMNAIELDSLQSVEAKARDFSSINKARHQRKNTKHECFWFFFGNVILFIDSWTHSDSFGLIRTLFAIGLTRR